MGNFLAGLYAIIFAIQGRILMAAYLILLAMLFDFVDGTVARLTKTESHFGMQLDSLCDIVSFGVAPMVLVYMLFMSQAEKFGWFSGVLFAACGVLRLARYNTQAKTDGKHYFDGLPIPAAAGFIVSYVIFCYTKSLSFLLALTPLLVMATALLMVSGIRYPSFRKLDFKRRRSLESMLLIILIAILATRDFYVFLVWCFTGYVLIGVISHVWKHPLWTKKKTEEVLASEEKP